MSKRRKSNQPNIPEETLRRARQEAGLEPSDPAEAAEAEAAPAAVAPSPTPPPAPRAAPSARREPARAAEPSTTARKRKRRTDKVSYEEMTHEEVLHLLDNPTKTVTEGELRAQYDYVLRDLRSMFILTVGLFVAMIVAATIFV